MRIMDKRSATRNLPPAPSLPSLPSVNIARDSLPAYNAEGQGLVAAGPRPAPPTLPNIPSLNVPAGRSFSLEEFATGQGFGQGIVPNTPLPAAPRIGGGPTLRLDAEYARRDQDLSRYNLRRSNWTPGGQYSRPSHTLEIYGQGKAIDVSHLERMKPVVGPVMSHSPDATFGGDPRFEAQRHAIRPTAQTNDPLAAMRSQKDTRMSEFVRANARNPVGISGFDRKNLGLKAETKRIPIQSMPILPAANMSHAPRVGHLLSAPKTVTMEAQYIAPPIRGADMGGKFSSMSSVSGNIGVHPGRAFGAEAHLFR